MVQNSYDLSLIKIHKENSEGDSLCVLNPLLENTYILDGNHIIIEEKIYFAS
jgi:hypothetical protein